MNRNLLCLASGLALILIIAPVEAQDEPQEDAEPEQQDSGREVRRLGDMVGAGTDDFSMDIPQIDMPQAPVEEQPDVALPDPQMDDRLQNILARRAFVPDDPEIEQELSNLLDEVEALAGQALADGDLDRAEGLARVIAEFDPERQIIADVAAAAERLETVERLIGQAGEALEAGSLIDPADGSALALYRQVLELDPDNEIATAGLDTVRAGVLERADTLLAESNFEAAAALLDRAAGIGVDAEQINQRREAIASAREDQRRSLINRTRVAIDSGNFDAAESGINELVALGLEADQIAQLRASLDDAARYSGFEPGQLFQDGLENEGVFGPVMVVIPAGSFLMGSPENEDDRVDNEGPRFRVTFPRGFAIARTEVTVGQFRRFVEDTGYVTDAERNGSSRIYMEGSGRVDTRSRVNWRDNYLGATADDDLPVIHVSWNDATAYAEWLTEQTGRSYRLPTEAEFEYSLRAGTQTAYWWGRRPDEEPENVTGDGDEFRDQRRWTVAFDRWSDGYWGPAPAGSLVANPFGLFDMGGNVMEWVLDCWHDSYVRAPTDGSAWVNPGCNRRVIRGASWSSTPAMSRSAFRLSSRTDVADARVGFRVARDL